MSKLPKNSVFTIDQPKPWIWSNSTQNNLRYGGPPHGAIGILKKVFMGKKKKINVLIAFSLFHKSGVKTFLK